MDKPQRATDFGLRDLDNQLGKWVRAESSLRSMFFLVTRKTKAILSCDRVKLRSAFKIYQTSLFVVNRFKLLEPAR